MSEHTLVESLRRQNNKNFIILLGMSAMDPCYSRRRILFDSVGVDVWPMEVELRAPRIEITVGDDDFLCGNFVNVIQRVPVQQQNTRLLAPNGFLFRDGALRRLNTRSGIVSVHQIVDDSHDSDSERLVSPSPAWIHVRHKQNMNDLNPAYTIGDEVADLNWPGWEPRIVDRIANTQIVTASAMGCEVYPTRSKSVVFAHGSARQRRKK